jgi:long-chain fatty acid transport protein
MHHQRIKSLLAMASGLSFALAANGAGFYIIEQSVSGLGNALSGAAAVAEDSSTVYFNPAGMILLDGSQIQSAAHLIMPKAEFINKGTLSAGTILTQGDNSDGGAAAVVPNLYYTKRISENLAVGLGINAPFGLATEYDKDWVGRYMAVRSEIQTININPAIAYRLNSQWTIGIGANVCYTSAQLTNAIDLNRDGTSLLDGFSDMEADDIGYGYNIGLLYEPTATTRIGLHYRSQVSVRLEGDANFTLPTLPAAMAAYAVVFADQSVEADLTMPDQLSVSIYHQFSDKLAIMADVTWMNWTTFYDLDIDFETATTESVAGKPVIENWRDAYRYSVGMDYKVSDTLKLRCGLAYDQTPIRSAEYRSPRIPDGSRKWIATGLSWNIRPNMTLDASYVHIFVTDPEVDNSTHTSNLHLIGTIDGSVDLLCASRTYKF